MQPADFRDFVNKIAREVGFPSEHIILGGDHLGPNCWQGEPAAEAMEKSVDLIKATSPRASAKSISMPPCPALTIRTAGPGHRRRTCRSPVPGRGRDGNRRTETPSDLCHRHEVPVPGGEASTIGSVHVTRAQDAAATLETHEAAFRKLGLNAALGALIAIVVQPGVEFDHTQIIHYQPEAAKALSAWIEGTPMVYEAHSTDYQSRQAYRALVRDHYAILKVGPALTFALREAIFALAQMENELVAPESRSR
ncbi:Tagatose-6-phosphate kinase GatZ [Klebsiella grimontii]|uniref:Tagatose-6-phosphate kinase GatZ n=1 Tax=Klebsiella grimontii TaxID=2058152 RepID=A0A7H4NW50_9ENTR|nr:Tagatose-6-phosphate kinase GatZ [Klebsiella grimontii]